MRNYLLALVTIANLTVFNLAVAAQTSKTPSDADKYKLGAEYSAANKGAAVLVMKGDRIVFEDYQNGFTAERAHYLASGTKSFCGVMLAAAIEDKLVSGFDEQVSDTITEWRKDPRKETITLRQLLTLTSGLDAGQLGRVPEYSEAINASVRFDAGTRFAYGPVPFQIFGEVMTRKLAPKKETVKSYLQRRILGPIGLKTTFWREFSGQPLLPQGATLTARDWVKFGLLLKNGGKWNGKQIIAKKLLAELVVGTKANPAYGITFWLNKDGKSPAGMPTAMRVGTVGREAVNDLFMAAGAGNQRLYVIPSQDVVIVRFGDFGEFDDGEFVGRLLFGKK